MSTLGVSIEPAETRTFLEALFAGKRDDLYILVWTLHDKQSHWFQDVGSAIRFAESMRGRDCYVGVGLSALDRGPDHRCPSDEAAGIVGLWADIDLRSDAHPKRTLPGTIEQALAMLPVDLPPSFIILTGNGIQVWWLFRESLIFESDEERRQASSLARRWQTLLSLRAASLGWTFDRLGDLARVLRVAGTQNCKDAANPKAVTIHSRTDRRYNLSDLAEYLDYHGIPDEEQSGIAKDCTGGLADVSLILNPSAAIAEDLLKHYMASDPRFEKTWLRQRTDLGDDSQSGYDMALANFGVGAGLTQQQIVDLIIHHRRIHGQRPQNRINYFHRTISKARKGSNAAVLQISSRTLDQQADEYVPEADADPTVARALRCERISAAIGVRVLRIVKISGHDPTYRLELEGAKICFPNVDRLVGQKSFRMKIASAADHLIPSVPEKVWGPIAQLMLDALTIEDGGDEADLVGAARMYVERYLSESEFIQAKEEQPYQTRFRPAVYEGQIAIRSSELQQHINKAWNENRPLKEVAAMLSALGAVSARPKRTALRDQSRWLLPVSEFPPDRFIGTEEASHAE